MTDTPEPMTDEMGAMERASFIKWRLEVFGISERAVPLTDDPGWVVWQASAPHHRRAALEEAAGEAIAYCNERESRADKCRGKIAAGILLGQAKVLLDFATHLREMAGREGS